MNSLIFNAPRLSVFRLECDEKQYVRVRAQPIFGYCDETGLFQGEYPQLYVIGYNLPSTESAQNL